MKKGESRFLLAKLFIVSILTLLIPVACSQNQSAGTNSAPKTDTNQNQKEASSGGSGNVSPAPYSEEVAKLYEAAKKEGSVVYWSPDDQELSKAFSEEFTKTFPGIKVETFETQSEQSIEKIVTEKNAGKLKVDALGIQLGNAPTMIDRDLLEPVDYAKYFGNSLTYFNNRLVTLYHLSYPIVYNTNLVKSEDVPKSWEDLLDPKWKGKIALESRGTPFPILAQQWGPDKMNTYLDSLLKQQPLIIRGGTPVADAVASGQVEIALGSYIYKTEVYKKKGAPVEWAKTGPIPVVPFVAGVLKDNPHPNAAKLFIAWVTSEAGLKVRDKVQSAGLLKLKDGKLPLSGPGQLLQQKNIEVLPVAEDYIAKQAELQQKVGATLSSLK